MLVVHHLEKARYITAILKKTELLFFILCMLVRWESLSLAKYEKKKEMNRSFDIKVRYAQVYFF